MVNWVCGRFLRSFQDSRWFPVSPQKMARGGEQARSGDAGMDNAALPPPADDLEGVEHVARNPASDQDRADSGNHFAPVSPRSALQKGGVSRLGRTPEFPGPGVP